MLIADDVSYTWNNLDSGVKHHYYTQLNSNAIRIFNFCDQAKIYINGTEGRVLRLLNVYVTSYNKEIEIQEGDIVAAAVKAKGKDISQMVTRYSQILDIPTDTQNTTDYYNKDVILYVNINYFYLFKKYNYFIHGKIDYTKNISIIDNTSNYILYQL